MTSLSNPSVAPSTSPTDHAALRYGLQMERARLRAIATRHRRDDDGEALARTQQDLVDLEQRLAATMRDDSRDIQLAQLLQLSGVELDLLWTVVAATVDPTLGPHLRELAGAESRHGISLSLHTILAGLGHDAARNLALALTPSHPLLRYGLLEANDGVQAACSLSVPTRVATHLAGVDRIDDAITRAGGLVRIEGEPHYDDAQLACAKQLVQTLLSNEPALVILDGPIDVGKRTAVAIAGMVRNQAVIQIDGTRLGSTAADLEATFVALRRESLLTNAIPVIAQVDQLVASDGEGRARMRLLGQLLDDTPVLVVVTSNTPGLELGTHRTVVRLSMPVPDVHARSVLWKRALEDEIDVDIDLLSSRYRLGAGGIQRAVAATRLLAPHGARIGTPGLVQGVRHGIAERLGELAVRVDVKQGWDDLVLGPDTLDQIKGLVARIRHGRRVFEDWGLGGKLPRGQGTAALFSGPPGTGKTMVAGLIARELDLELYQVDLSRVVSKWVGETEKQLSKVFDAAEVGHALLLFDEADALFAKRTEVKSSNDRYANLEVNYLLQRIESFGGLSILTTNLDTSIDPALRRRLAAHVVFYAPDVDEREALWGRLLPAETPRKGKLDFEALAHDFPDMTGANIRNAVVAAAFLAASENVEVTQAHLGRAARGEYRAMGRVVR